MKHIKSFIELFDISRRNNFGMALDVATQVPDKNTENIQWFPFVSVSRGSKMQLFRFMDKRSKVLFLFVEGLISLSCSQTEVFSHLRLASIILSSSNLSLSVVMVIP